MNVEIQANPIKEPYKKEIFEMFLLWESMPGLLKTLTPERLEPLELTPEQLDLAKLRSDREFAAHFEVVVTAQVRNAVNELQNIVWAIVFWETGAATDAASEIGQ